MKRAVVVINKWWECEPALSAMLNGNAKPSSLPWPVSLSSPRPRPDPQHLPAENPNPMPRAVFQFSRTSVEVWCISDLLEHLPDKPSYQSSSEQKAKVLPKMFVLQSPDLVIAVGTAGLPYDTCSENGNGVIGTKIFMHNGAPDGSNPDSNWRVGPFDQVIDSKLDRAAFAELVYGISAAAPNVFLVPPINPSSSNRLLADYDNIALGTTNVTDYTKYAVSDLQTVRALADGPISGKPASLETTHGLIRVQSDAPFLFVSGITDRLGHFDQEVTPRSYSQNTSAAHNAGVAVAWLLPQIDKIL